MSYLNQFLFGIYPYVALVVFFAGSLLRFDRDQYTWKSDSSQLLRAGQLRWGSNLFHLGILGIFFGHLFGLLTPLAVWHFLGVSAPAKQLLAVVAGGIAGIACLVGLVLLLHRRLTEPRIRATTKADGHRSCCCCCSRSCCWACSASRCRCSTWTARR